MKPLHLSVLLLSLSLVAPSTLRAAFFSIDDTATNETITISANDFEFGLTINGVPFQQGLNNPRTATFPETGPISFSGQWIDNGQTVPGAHIIFLVEASDPTLISDILQYTLDSDPFDGVGFINGTFQSDVNDNLGHLPANVDPSTVFVENGQPVNFGAPFLTAFVISDAEVPEPGAVSLFLIGLLSLGGFKLRHLRRSGAK
jgi:hypothetical protein